MENLANMKAPYLEIYVDEKEGLCIARAKAKNVPFHLLVNIPLDELSTYDPEDVAYRIGGTALNLLQSWHGKLFSDWKSPAVKGSQENYSSYIGALRLIDLALSAKTSVHNASIEALLQEAAKENEDARKYLAEAWPLLRDRLTRLDG